MTGTGEQIYRTTGLTSPEEAMGQGTPDLVEGLGELLGTRLHRPWTSKNHLPSAGRHTPRMHFQSALGSAQDSEHPSAPPSVHTQQILLALSKNKIKFNIIYYVFIYNIIYCM